MQGAKPDALGTQNHGGNQEVKNEMGFTAWALSLLHYAGIVERKP